MTNVFKLTKAFNKEICGIEAPLFPGPSNLCPERKEWTVTALREEVEEFANAVIIEDEVDALGDLIYFAAGRFYEMGVDGGAVFREIHKANMDKVRGELAKRPGSKGHDAVKPDGWEAPDHTDTIFHIPRIMVVGHGRHGKDTVCEILRDEHGFNFTSSSWFCAEKIMYRYFLENGIEYRDIQACYDDRHTGDNRSIWFEKISEYAGADKTRLTREIFEENDVYCGCRNAEELLAAVRADLVDHVVWVDRSEVVGPEAFRSNTITKGMADYVLDNNGTKWELRENIQEMLNSWR